MLEVFDFKELVLWCADKFNVEQRIIQLEEKTSVPLTPTVFRKMLQLPTPNKMLKGPEADAFLDAHDGGARPPENISHKATQ
jgi:hypothetical protein